MSDLKTQLNEYLDHVVVRLDANDILEERVGAEPVRSLRPRQPRPWQRLKGWATAAATAAIVVLVVGGVAWLSRTGDAAEPASPLRVPTTESGTPTTEPAARTPEPVVTEVVTYDVGFNLWPTMVATSSGIWGIVMDNVLERVDPVSGEPSGTVALDASRVLDLASTPDAVWALAVAESDSGEAVVYRIDAASVRVTDTFEVPGAADSWGIVIAGGGIWVSDHNGGITRIDLATDAVNTYDFGAFRNAWRWVGEHEGGLWAHLEVDGGSRLTRFDLATSEIDAYIVPVGGLEAFAMLGEGEIWVSNLQGRLARFDLHTRESTPPIQIGETLAFGAYADGAVWMPQPGGRLTRIDASNGDVTGVIVVDSSSWCLLAHDGALWTSDPESGTVSRIKLGS